MSDWVIRTEGLGKRYRIGPRESYLTLRDTLARLISAPLRMAGGKRGAQPAGDDPRWIWALQNVSFEAKRGEVIGLIGPNGAGKTTLLKILSKITEPTRGRAEIRGRVGSLLEVGTGFHPELSGRENVYFSGAILGMKKSEIDRKFGEILAFSDLDRFVDTPLKYYSTGMQVRLAFSIAAHLEPEVLLVDEVLAVGDALFQKKCLGKMGDVARSGRTILFVSHNLQAISTLCHKTALIQGGNIVRYGPAREVISFYLAQEARRPAEIVWGREDSPGKPPFWDVVRLRAVRVLDGQHRVCGEFSLDQPVTLVVEFSCLKPSPVFARFHVLNDQGVLVLSTANLNDWKHPVPPGRYRCSCAIPAHLLAPGTYRVSAFLTKAPLAYPDVFRVEAVSFRLDAFDQQKEFVMENEGLIQPLLDWSRARVE